MKLYEIVGEIQVWSWENFGHNESKRPGGYGALYSLAPLMGMGEEIGEYVEAWAIEDEYERKTQQLDAIGDIMIYMLDYMWREGMDVETFFAANDSFIFTKESPLMVHYGRLLHATLKAHQGIRGYNDPAKYCAERNAAIATLTSQLRFLVPNQQPLEDVVTNTWQKIVSKRNWRAR